jgi:DNA polymerase-3 subunit epsilon
MLWLKRLFGQATVINQNRWVVLDVETSGLDPRQDRLFANEAVCIHHNEDQRLKIDIFSAI